MVEFCQSLVYVVLAQLHGRLDLDYVTSSSVIVEDLNLGGPTN
jgi:hypothetical protein